MQVIKLRLPFSGQWLVFWGGDTKKLNHHHDIAAQKYAVDFVVTDKTGKSYRSNGLKNEDYFCFGKNILAPADGKVVEAVEGVRDNEPRDTNPYVKTGNYVLIKHGNDKFSFLAHLRQGSVAVKKGDTIKTGQKLGECGNSGNSSEPHLHYHLQNSFVFNRFDKSWKTKDIAQGLKVNFAHVNVAKTGKEAVRESYSPIKGDIVEQL